MTQQMDIRELDPLSATEPMVIRQQEELEEQGFGIQPEGETPGLPDALETWLLEWVVIIPLIPELLTNESKTWSKKLLYYQKAYHWNSTWNHPSQNESEEQIWPKKTLSLHNVHNQVYCLNKRNLPSYVLRFEFLYYQNDNCAKRVFHSQSIF